jgi:NAD-dependent dihydropyrimidine dehydrogenase PreA subunit
MPKKTAVINYQNCQPEYCENGICAAVLVCRHDVLKQEEPFEKPDPPMICVGCGTCIPACDKDAIFLI